jgi:hypothetical protein
MRNEQEDETATLGRTFARDADKANAFSKLSRYETTIERLIYRALHELERRQAGRSGAAPSLGWRCLEASRTGRLTAVTGP